ncbi:hypothetical protein [Streptomyces sp. NPDC001404]|uniref:hypothetical protein n=1 Tax=Streptomyces sp. NPDC001404 TaxID=3364571 RepID=UPI00368B9317
MDYGQAGDGQVPEQTPTPPLWLRLPDGQEIVGRLLGRRQTADGRWWYDVTLPLWSRTIIAGRDHCEPSDVHFTVPATHLEPLEGTSYWGVPIRRHPKAIFRARTGRKPPAPPPIPEPAATAPRASRAPDASKADTGRWKV